MFIIIIIMSTRSRDNYISATACGEQITKFWAKRINCSYSDLVLNETVGTITHFTVNKAFYFSLANQVQFMTFVFRQLAVT